MYPKCKNKAVLEIRKYKLSKKCYYQNMWNVGNVAVGEKIIALENYRERNFQYQLSQFLL